MAGVVAHIAAITAASSRGALVGRIINRGRTYWPESTLRSRSNHDPFDLIEADLVATAVVEAVSCALRHGSPSPRPFQACRRS
jgi:hypothetical protein